MSEQNTSFDLDQLLDGTLDDLADAPEYRPWPAGTHRFTLKLEFDTKVKSVIYAKLKLLETIEQVDSEEKPLEVGAEANLRYDLSNEYAQGNFKRILVAAAAHFGAKKNSELIQEMNNVECLGITKQIVSKKNKDAVYTDLVELQIV